MDKRRMEMILPVRTNFNRLEKKSEPILVADLLHVKPIVSYQIQNSKIKNIPPPATNSGIKYINRKQEQFHRLNRTNKLKKNDEIAEQIAKKDRQSAVSLNSKVMNNYKKLQETNLQIDESSEQLQKISSFIQAKKNELKMKRLPNSVITLNHVKPKPEIHSDLNVKHTCTKKIYPNKTNNAESIHNTSKISTKQESRKVPLRNEKNNLARKKLDSTLTLMNAKLNKVKEKYFNDDFETNHFTDIVNRKPKYKSVKDLIKMHVNEDLDMEASKIIKNGIDKDLYNELDNTAEVLSKNDQMESLFKNVDLIQKDSFQDNFSDECRDESPYKVSRTPRKYMPITSPQPNRYSLKTNLKDKKVTQRNVEIDATHSVLNDLEASIMKSNYLMKEFGIGQKGNTITTIQATSSANMRMSSGNTPNINRSKLTSPNINKSRVNSAKLNIPKDDLECTAVKRWTRDLEYFMT